MILVTGASGFVGSRIMEFCKDVIPCPSLKGKSEDEIKGIVESSNVTAIIHTAAIADTGVCRADPEASYIANVLLPVYLAKASKNIKLICFSSDQVYTGSDLEGPFTEDMAKPGNVYAEHKLEMEQRVLDIAPDSVMLRAEWMYDYYLKKSNYFMNIINAADTISYSSKTYRGVTYVKEVAQNMEKVIKLPGGVYNFGSETSCSMYDLTRIFLDALGKNIKLEDGPKGCNLFMNCQKARNFGVDFQKAEDGLIRCAKEHNMLSPSYNIDNLNLK